ncbi:MAG: phytanoyl-CoA dioxygenase family protein [Burkholderiaceae bacterium]
MLSNDQIERYHRDGYIVVQGVVDAAWLSRLRAATERIVAGAANVDQHDAVYDLEPGHSRATPQVRRIKNPERVDPVFAELAHHSGIAGCLQQLWGGRGVRFDISKLNMKSAGFGSPVEWHQDWAFYPHTNDDLAAVGVMLDDITPDNGPMQIVPGSHRGPVFDHHAHGYFCGAIDALTPALGLDTAEPCLGPAGSITIHHARAVHGSAPNHSGLPRRFLLLQYRCADAWPLVTQPENWDTWCADLVAGSETLEPRTTAVPVRLPFPVARKQGSIYENQADVKNRFFAPR